MIGFELDAYGSPGTFNFHRACWSEGSLWLLKQGISKSKNKMAGSFKTEDMIDLVEQGFAKLKELHFEDICSLNFEFDLHVRGSFNFYYHFPRPNTKSSMSVRVELLRKIAEQYNEMGDQVTLAFCDAIKNYAAHCLGREEPRSSPSRQLDMYIWL